GIIGLVIGFGVTAGSNALKSAQRIKTQERLATIQMALEEYVNLNGFLPCPANRLVERTELAGLTFGIESRDGNDACLVGPGLILEGNAYLGMVPVDSLGLPAAFAADAWGNKFTYAVSMAHVGLPI